MAFPCAFLLSLHQMDKHITAISWLRGVQEWLADPRFANLQRPLQKVKQKLEQFMQQAKRL
jgi:hypothetical protein